MRNSDNPYKVVGTYLHNSGHYDFPSEPDNKISWHWTLEKAVSWALWERTIGTRDLSIFEREVKLEVISRLVNEAKLDFGAITRYKEPSDGYFHFISIDIINSAKKQVI